MPKRKKPIRRKPVARSVPPLERLGVTWAATRRALLSAEQQLERQVRGLLRDRAGSRDAAARVLKGWRSRAERERQALARTARESVQSALAALNIPTRDEIARLTRRVEALSRRLDARQR